MILKNPSVQAAPQTIQQNFWVWDQALLWKFPRCFYMQLKLGLTLALALHFGKCQDYREPGGSRAARSEILYSVGLG